MGAADRAEPASKRHPHSSSTSAKRTWPGPIRSRSGASTALMNWCCWRILVPSFLSAMPY